MRKSVLSAVLGVAAVASAFTMVGHIPSVKPITSTVAAYAEKVYKVVPEESTINWIGRKVTGEHTGTIKVASGTVKVNGTMLRGGTFTMDMNSITVTDLKEAGPNQRLLTHLKSEDFFSVEKFPTATFTITNLSAIPKAKAGSANFNITGSLVIKGITNQITFPVALSIKKDVLTAKGNLKFDRTKWDIKYRSTNFFENMGDKAIYDDVELNVNLVAKL